MGLESSLSLIGHALEKRRPATGPEVEASAALAEDLGDVGELLRTTPADLLGCDEWLAKLDHAALGLIGRVRALLGAQSEGPEQLESWAHRFSAQVQEHRADLAALAPWLETVRELDVGGGAAQPGLLSWADEGAPGAGGRSATCWSRRSA